MFLNSLLFRNFVVNEGHRKLFIVAKGHSNDKSQSGYSKTTVAVAKKVQSMRGRREAIHSRRPTQFVLTVGHNV